MTPVRLTPEQLAALRWIAAARADADPCFDRSVIEGIEVLASLVSPETEALAPARRGRRRVPPGTVRVLLPLPLVRRVRGLADALGEGGAGEVLRRVADDVIRRATARGGHVQAFWRVDNLEAAREAFDLVAEAVSSYQGEPLPCVS